MKRNTKLEKVILKKGVDERMLVPLDYALQIQRNKHAIQALIDGWLTSAQECLNGDKDEEIFGA